MRNLYRNNNDVLTYIFRTHFWQPKGAKCPKEQSQALTGLGLFLFELISEMLLKGWIETNPQCR